MNSLSLRARAATAAVIGAGTLAVVAVTSGASAAQPHRNVTQSSRLTVESATRAAQAALDAAGKAGQKVSVAVVDRDGNTVVTLRGNGAGPQSYESAQRKAFTAVSWNAPTSDLVKRLAQTPNLKDIPGTLFLPGGAPVAVEGAPVAAVGVAGAPSGDLDEKFAAAGAAAALGR
ncbi:heme-binding protein [Streptomyces sp. I05A-00742]|uniref:GlcG/HbpS family heme-binding protein n=1 Tax=Streptomyces sp. I05A-00742 TaxID=2732853 RepID=UPI0014893CB8|nr:heme-binding protein [Streptomyces sp. I05A-00742]